MPPTCPFVPLILPIASQDRCCASGQPATPVMYITCTAVICRFCTGPYT